MSAKDQREADARDAHKARLRRQQAPALRWAAPAREENPVLLILCQGEVTEVEYFRHFELATATIEAVGRAFDPEKLVEHALELRDQAKRRREPYDQVWCVFDKDDTRPGNFNAAIQRAQGTGLEVAFSNQAFEFWLLLHFDDHQGGGMGREACGERLADLIAAANPRVRYNPKKASTSAATSSTCSKPTTPPPSRAGCPAAKWPLAGRGPLPGGGPPRAPNGPGRNRPRGYISW